MRNRANLVKGGISVIGRVEMPLLVLQKLYDALSTELPRCIFYWSSFYGLFLFLSKSSIKIFATSRD